MSFHTAHRFGYRRCDRSKWRTMAAEHHHIFNERFDLNPTRAPLQ
jgi:hypothetical protein